MARARRLGWMAALRSFVRKPDRTPSLKSIRGRRWFALVVTGVFFLLVAGCSSVGPTGTSGTVTVTRAAPVSWVAVQDGADAWRPLVGASFDVSDGKGRYGVAWICPGDNWVTPIPPMVGVVHAILSEATSITAFCPTVTTYLYPPPHSISGTMSNIPAGGFAMVGVTDPYGSAYWPSVYSPGGPYSFSLQEPGVYALLAFTKDASSSPDRMVMRRGVAVSGDVTGEDIDFSTGVPFSMASVTASSVFGGNPYVTAYLTLADGGAFVLPEERSGPSVSFPTLPTSLREPDDCYEAMAGSSGLTDFQVGVVAVEDPSPGVSVQLPAPMPSGVRVVPSGAAATVTWPPVTLSGVDGTSVFVAWAIATTSNWVALVSKGWLGTSSAYTYPDLSAVSGWRASWNFPQYQNGQALVGVLRASAGLNPFKQMLPLVSGLSPLRLPAGAKEEGTFGWYSVTY